MWNSTPRILDGARMSETLWVTRRSEDRKRILRRNKEDPAKKKTSSNGEQQSSTTALLTLSEIRGNVKWGGREATKSGVKEAKRGRFMIALKAFDRAIELDPKHVDAYVARGAVLAKIRTQRR